MVQTSIEISKNIQFGAFMDNDIDYESCNECHSTLITSRSNMICPNCGLVSAQIYSESRLGLSRFDTYTDRNIKESTMIFVTNERDKKLVKTQMRFIRKTSECDTREFHVILSIIGVSNAFLRHVDYLFRKVTRRNRIFNSITLYLGCVWVISKKLNMHIDRQKIYSIFNTYGHHVNDRTVFMQIQQHLSKYWQNQKDLVLEINYQINSIFNGEIANRLVKKHWTMPVGEYLTKVRANAIIMSQKLRKHSVKPSNASVALIYGSAVLLANMLDLVNPMTQSLLAECTGINEPSIKDVFVKHVKCMIMFDINEPKKVKTKIVA